MIVYTIVVAIAIPSQQKYKLGKLLNYKDFGSDNHQTTLGFWGIRFFCLYLCAKTIFIVRFFQNIIISNIQNSKISKFQNSKNNNNTH